MFLGGGEIEPNWRFFQSRDSIDVESRFPTPEFVIFPLCSVDICQSHRELRREVLRSMPLKIIHFPHPTLRRESKPIRRVDAGLKKIAAEMLDLMYEANGVGLAANQVDLPLRMFVANPSGVKGDGEEWVVLNPVLQNPKGHEAAEEGCLSLPGVHGLVTRPKEIHLSGYDLSGKEIDFKAEGFLARIFMHENDHLDGVMFFDRMGDSGREDLYDPLEELELDFRSRQRVGAIASDEELIAALAAWEEKYA